MIKGRCMICGEDDLLLEFHHEALACWLCCRKDMRLRGEQLLLRGLMCQVLADLIDGKFHMTEHGPIVYTADSEVMQ